MAIRWGGRGRTGSVDRARPCPPHGPIMVAAVERQAYVARCMRCGISGPAREDGVDAKQAFDEAFREGR